MASNNPVLLKAEFNPNIKNYILIVGVFMLLITVLGIILLPFWLLGLGRWFANRYYSALNCELTSRHLRFKKGLFTKVEKTIPLENIQDLTFIDNPFLRWFDLRVLKIETAGGGNQMGSDMKLIGILDTEELKEKVLDQRDKWMNQKEGSNASRNSESADTSIALLTEIRDLLKEMKQSKQ